MAEGEHHRFMTRLLEQAHFEKARISTIDGLRATSKTAGVWCAPRTHALPGAALRGR